MKKRFIQFLLKLVGFARPEKSRVRLCMLLIIGFLFSGSAISQQNVFSRSEVVTGNWWDGANPWFYQFNGNQNRPDNFSRNYVKIGHNNNLSMTTNGAFFQLASLDFESGATSVRTINSGGAGTGISLTIGIFNQSVATHIINTDIGIDATTVQLYANNTGGLTFGGTNIYINANTVEFGGLSNISVGNILSGSNGKLTKAGSAVLTLTGANSYTGLTTINGGTLQLNRPVGNTIPVTNNVTVSSGTLRVSTNQTLASIINNGSVIIDPGVTLTVGSITGTGTITGSATSNLVLTGTGSSLNFDQTTASARSLNNLTLNSGAGATLNSTMDVYGTINLTSATLNCNFQNIMLRSNASGTARIADLTGSTLSNANNFTVERYIKLRAGGTGRAYRLLTPTVTTTSSVKQNWMENGMNTAIGTNENLYPNYGTQITGAGGNTNGFDITAGNSPSLYNAANGTTPTYTAIGNTNGPLNALTGYFLYLRGDRSMDMTLPLASGMPTSSTTLRATGSIVQGTQTSFTNAFTGGGAFNLVTNPYPSPIDWSLVQPACTGITDFYTYWDPNMGTRGAFVAVNKTEPGPTRYIQPGQAFFVQSNGAVPTVTIQESHKAAGNNNEVFLLPPPPAESFRTGLYFTEPNGFRRMADGVTVLYDNKYGAAVDAGDAEEINNWDENIAIARQGKHLSIEARPVITKSDDLPIFMNNMKKQKYEFEFTPSVFTNTNLKAELVDNFLGTRTLLSVTAPTVVSFTITDDAASKATDRFKVVFGQFGNPTGVDAITIKASQLNSGVQVEWTSKTETDMVRYEVERSTYGTTFAKVNSTTAAGNSTNPVDYSWFDTNPTMGTSFYRIKGIDKGGNVRYSEMVRVLFGKGEPGVVVYPNPVEGQTFKMDMYNLVKGTYVLNLYSNEGRLVHTQQIQHDGSQATRTITLQPEIAKGTYQLQLMNSNGFKTSKILIKN